MRRLLPVLLALPGLMGCAESLDTARAEREIAAGYIAQTPGVDVRSVDCPSGVPADVGSTATCRMLLAGGARLDVAVRVIGEGGRIRWTVLRPGTRAPTP
jgi:hypothetical protein